MAIGMKRMSLRAEVRRTRSVRTANSRPSAVTRVGATTTHTMLLVMALRVSPAVIIVT